VTAILWLRRDLRLSDHRALAAALAHVQDARGPVLPLFILDDADAGPAAPGGASRWWLHGSLEALDADLRARGSRLLLRKGPAQEVLDEVCSQTGATAVFWSRRYEPWAMRRDESIKAALRARGLQAHSAAGSLLHEPHALRTLAGDPYRVFTPFWRKLREVLQAGLELPAPEHLPAPRQWPASDALQDWGLRPARPDWAGGLRERWVPGEAAALARCTRFLDEAVLDYHERRDLPGVAATSRLSPHLHFGEISPRQVWLRARSAFAAEGEDLPEGVHKFLAEIAWREFGWHLLVQFPALPERPFRPEFESFPWREDAAALRAWTRGRTGYPIVDAGMRELWHSGWMHNRVRMIVASFLVKDLRLAWQSGAQWFWDTLVDADLGSNSASWQWVAGCGADAAPYFRIFNPALQSARFDPHGDYIRRWVPELARLPAAALHDLGAARPVDLAAAGIRPGHDYPLPLVDHARAKSEALAALQSIRARTGPA
jgi:deoxyribodipyrimidine photo-lyase